MFFCRRNPLLTLLLMVLGLKVLKKEKWSDEERARYREKRRTFRHKLHEAFDVWDDSTDDLADDADEASSGKSSKGS